MAFHGLPEDLKNVICSFAYDTKWKTVTKSLNQCEKVAKMNLHKVLTNEKMWSFKYRAYIPNPLIVFEPIENYNSHWREYIDWCAVNEILFRLDFRRKWVNFVFSRDQWSNLFSESWESIEHFDSFFRFLLNTRVDCLKPLWKPCGFEFLKSYAFVAPGYMSASPLGTWWG